MTAFDRRHRWGEPIREGATVTRICRVCGRSETQEVIVPDAFIRELARFAEQPNPLRALRR